MTDRPILFSGPMIRAILEGRKTQTRRVIPHPFADGYFDGEIDCTFVPAPASNLSAYFRFGASAVGGGAIRTEVYTPRFAPGDRLWVREAFSYETFDVDRDGTLPPWYWADGNPTSGDFTRPKPSIHMPRWASRLTLIVTDVRVQRLQDISEDDAVAEGAPVEDIRMYPEFGTARHWFRDLWDSLNAKRGFGWDTNPWVCAITFEAHKCNIDRMDHSDV